MRWATNNYHQYFIEYRGGYRISGKGVHMYKCVGRMCSFFLKYPMKMK